MRPVILARQPNRGFAMQLTTVRYLGLFLTGPGSASSCAISAAGSRRPAVRGRLKVVGMPRNCAAARSRSQPPKWGVL